MPPHRTNSICEAESTEKCKKQQERCGKTVGGVMYLVDDHHIVTFRNNYLKRWEICPFISVVES